MTTKDLKTRLGRDVPPTPERKIAQRVIASLKPSPSNSRTHTPKQIRQIADSIRRFGFTNPILIDRHGTVLAGHARLAAARLLGLDVVPTICLEHLTEAEKRAYLIADNRLAEKGAGWDRDVLATEFSAIAELDSEFDLELTGFEMEDIELILDARAGAEGADEDDQPEIESGPAVCRAGDLWHLGEHKLYCGDATQWTSYVALMGAERARVVFTDPPFNVPIAGHVSGLGKHERREFIQASGEMNEAEFTRFLTLAVSHAAKASHSGSVHYVCMDWRHLGELLHAGRAVYDSLLNICVWVKNNGGMGSLYRSRYELVCVFKKGKRAHRNNVELGSNGRYRTNVWEYAGANSFSATRAEDLAMHPTVKPVALVADAILDTSDRGDIVLDPFGGSGTTVMAAEQTGRVARLMEMDPLYCDVILRRFERKIGIAPTLDGRSFAEVAALRTDEVRHG